ncbi:hypothetical protein BCR35DRAFT_191441 [Leucosporidium creatinivorum]|uniref:Uncharacterized protein n=1 Tax=Leucosporidium creatinivorum TaxID=106004 RepID=A0A1Y2FYA6_9BASI|nr:hypothetical protein BCR35DRAFT_191441 [Leucosporidium creatinivorum]
MPSDRQLFTNTNSNRIHTSFLDFQTPPPHSPVPIANQSHFRTGSLFSTPSSFPPRLQNALETFSRGFSKGHASSASMGGPLTRSFTMPGMGWGVPKPSPSAVPLPESPSVGLAPGYFPPVAQTPSPSAQGAFPSSTTTATPLSNARGRRLTLAELSRGFGVTTEDEEEVEPRHSSAPSRRNSGMSVKTGVASLSDIATDSAAEEQSDADVVTNPSDDEEVDRKQNLKRSLHLHQNSLGTEALAMKREALKRATGGNYSGEEGGYDGSEDGEGELSEGEYSNPSEEERARRRAQDRSALQLEAQARKAHAPPNFGDDESLASGGLEPPEDRLIFQAPSDVDRSPVVENVAEQQQQQEKGSHKVTSNFSFPPKTPPRLLPPTRGADNLQLDPTPAIDRLDLSAAPLPSPAPPPIFSKALNVAAPEFVFGGGAKTKELRVVVAPTFGRKSSTTSLGSAGFGPFGAPGSLSVDSPTFTPPSTSISPSAPEFVPSYKATNPDPPSEDPTPSPELAAPKPSTFDFQLPADAPTLTIPPRDPPSSRGPLPPIPLTSVTPHSASVKRQKVDADSTGHVYFSGSSTASQTLHTLPHPSPQHADVDSSSSPSDGESTTNDDPAEQSFASTTGGDDPLPEQYAPIQNLGRSFTSSGRPFTLRPAASFSSDGRVVGFTTRRPPIPHFGGETPRRDVGVAQRLLRSPSDSGGRSRTGSRTRGPEERKESLDDIALPSGLRPKSQAIAIPQRVDRSGSAIEEDGEEDVFDSDAMPLTPDGEEVTDEEREDEDDYPLRILEEIISTQFDGLREELSGLTSLKEDIDSLKGEAVLDALAARIEGVIADARTADADERSSVLKEVVDEGQKRTEEALLGAIQDLKAQYQASRMVVTAPTSPAAHSVDFSDDLRDSLVEAVSKAVQSRLLPSPAETSTPRDRKEELREVVQASIKPLVDLVASTASTVAPSSSEPQTDLLAKLDTSLSTLLAQAETITTSLTTSSDLNTKERASLIEELQTSIKSITLQSPPVNVDADDIVFRLALAVQPQLNGIVERFGDKKKETAEYLVEQLRPVVEASKRAELTLDQEKLVEAFVERIKPLIASAAPTTVVASDSAPLDLDALVDRITATRPKEEDWSTRFDSLQKALERDDGARPVEDTLSKALEALQKDIGTRMDAFDKLVAEQLKALAASQAPSDRISDLEAQLVKARNDHGKVRSEKATLAERLETDRTRHIAETDKLKTEALERDTTARESELEKTLLTQTVEGLQAELSASKSSNEQLVTQLAASKEKEETSHTKELKHVAEVAKQQARARVLEAAVDSSKTRIEALSAEVSQVRVELASVKNANELLVEEKASIDRICQLEREQAAVARGEIIALEKRVATQDERILNLTRVKATQQQALAQANQRVVTLKKQADELDCARRRIEQLTSTTSIIEDRLNASEASRTEALTETEAYRERFASLERDLETMKEAVRSELEDTAGRLTSLSEEKDQVTEERDRLQRENAELVQALEGQDNSAFLRPPLYSTPNSNPPSIIHAPQSVYGYPQPRLLNGHGRSSSSSDSDDDSEGTIHEGVSHVAVSPTPSLGGKSIVVDDSGWWSSS